MAEVDMDGFLSLFGKQLQPVDLEQLKYILEDSFTGKSKTYLEQVEHLRWSCFAIIVNGF